MAFRGLLLAALLPALAAGSAAHGQGIVGRRREGALLQTWGAALDGQGASARDTPVTRVVKLLEEMSATLGKEMDEDAALYDKLACWCNTNEYEKTNSISEAESKISELTSSIEANTAKVAELKTAIKQLEEDIASNKKALAEATALRAKEAKAFHESELGSIQSIENLKAALTVLSKHHSLLQVPKTHIMGVAATLGYQLRAHEKLLKGVLSPSQRRAVAAFVQAPADYFDAEPTFKQSYAPASGEIFGILKQMKETFESNLSQSQKDEMAAQKGYEELKAAKEELIASMTDQIETKTQELASTDEKLAQAKEDIEDTRNSLAGTRSSS